MGSNMMVNWTWNDSEYNNNNNLNSGGMSSNNDGPPIPYSVFLNEYQTYRKRPRRWDNPADGSIDGESFVNRQQQQEIYAATETNRQQEIYAANEPNRQQEEYAPNATNRWGFQRGRSPSTCQSTGHPTFERFNRNDWRCSACYLWNSLERSRCLRCNSIQGSLMDRERSQSRNINRQRPPPNKTSELWPPEFSTNGSEYVFDSRSNMFYVSRSDFFYDPKSTLYYGNKKGAYYRYNDTKSPPFEKVDRTMVRFADPSGRTPHGGIATADQVDAKQQPAKNSGKKKLTIKINTVAIITTPVVKKQAVDIDRWTNKRAASEHQEKTKAPEPTEARGGPSKTTTTPVRPVAAAPKSAVSSKMPTGTTKPLATESKLLSKDDAGGDIVRSSAGEPICAICMRKFPNTDKLKLHETTSALHKENLAKLGELERSRSAAAIPERQQGPSPPMRMEAPAASTQYVDRAKKRRNLYGESIMPPPIRPLAVAPVVHAVVDPEKNLGLTSVGNKLFQKMLLKSQATAGAAPGDQSPASSASSSAAAAASTGGVGTRVVSSDLTNNLRKDWARIESMAHGAMQRQRTGSRFTGGKGLGNNAPR